MDFSSFWSVGRLLRLRFFSILVNVLCLFLHYALYFGLDYVSGWCLICEYLLLISLFVIQLYQIFWASKERGYKLFGYWAQGHNYIW
jgi:hypothetical protein